MKKTLKKRGAMKAAITWNPYQSEGIFQNTELIVTNCYRVSLHAGVLRNISVCTAPGCKQLTVTPNLE